MPTIAMNGLGMPSLSQLTKAMNKAKQAAAKTPAQDSNPVSPASADPEAVTLDLSDSNRSPGLLPTSLTSFTSKVTSKLPSLASFVVSKKANAAGKASNAPFIIGGVLAVGLAYMLLSGGSKKA